MAANIGLQRTAPCGLAAEAASFGPGWLRRRSRVVGLASVCLFLIARASSAAPGEHIVLGAVSRITIDAANPWTETIAAVSSDSLDHFLSDPSSPRVTVATTDGKQIAAIVKALGSAVFDTTAEHDGSIDLRYRLTFAGSGESVILYADAVGNILRDGRILRVRDKARWLSSAWNAIVNRSEGSYAPTR